MPKRVENLDAIRTYVTRGWDVYKMGNHYYTDAVNEIENSSDEDQQQTTSSDEPTAEPTTTQNNLNGNDSLGEGYLEFIEDNPENVVEVSEDERYADKDSESEPDLNLNLSYASDDDGMNISVVTTDRRPPTPPNGQIGLKSIFHNNFYSIFNYTQALTPNY